MLLELAFNYNFVQLRSSVDVELSEFVPNEFRLDEGGLYSGEEAQKWVGAGSGYIYYMGIIDTFQVSQHGVVNKQMGCSCLLELMFVCLFRNGLFKSEWSASPKP
jgi:hypothetical protein